MLSAANLNIFRLVVVIFKSFLLFLKHTKRRWWVREINKTRDEYGFFVKGIREMKMKDSEHFVKATRLKTDQFKLLFNILKEKLTKHSRRKPIEPEFRLALTLMYLAHGGSLQVMAWTFKIGVSTARKIIRETCDIIWDELHTIYLAPPNNNEWKTIAQNFWRKRQMPNCIGAIDGKHIHITCPAKSGSLYFNYKKHHSIVLLAACDANYCFLAVDVGAYGSRSDGGVFGNSAFGRKLSNGKLNIPESQTLPNSNIKHPFYFVGDAAFPLKKNLMRPYPGRDLSLEKEKFNNRLSRARCLIENSFGILANRWRILGTKMNCSPKIATKIVLAVTVLHNFLMLMKSSEYCPDDYCDTEEDDVVSEGRWRQEGIELESTKSFRVNRASREAFNLRDTLAGYFYNN